LRLLAARWLDYQRRTRQQPTLPVVGFLHSGPAGSNALLVDAFRRALTEAGYVESRNVALEYLWVEGHC